MEKSMTNLFTISNLTTTVQDAWETVLKVQYYSQKKIGNSFCARKFWNTYNQPISEMKLTIEYNSIKLILR